MKKGQKDSKQIWCKMAQNLVLGLRLWVTFHQIFGAKYEKKNGALVKGLKLPKIDDIIRYKNDKCFIKSESLT